VPPPQEMGRLASLFSFIERYPNAPALITKYVQTFANAAILTFAFYVVYSVWSTIRADVDRASEDSAAEILAEMAACAKNYVDNRCGGNNRLPALETVCNNWELCMNRDPNSIRRAQVSAHTFAQIINSFVEPISLKTMVCVFSRLYHSMCFGLRILSCQEKTRGDFYTDFCVFMWQKDKTINSRYSLVVTHPTTNLPARGLSATERTGSPALHVLWSIANSIDKKALMKR
jgi:hypothetical protein